MEGSGHCFENFAAVSEKKKHEKKFGARPRYEPGDLKALPLIVQLHYFPSSLNFHVSLSL